MYFILLKNSNRKMIFNYLIFKILGKNIFVLISKYNFNFHILESLSIYFLLAF